MNQPHDPNRTVDVPSTPSDPLNAGLAVGFGSPRSSLGLSEGAAQEDRTLKQSPKHERGRHWHIEWQGAC
jgi:hypothetical protein